MISHLLNLSDTHLADVNQHSFISWDQTISIYIHQASKPTTKNMCKETKKNLSETLMLNQACKTPVRAKKTVQPVWYKENKAL